MIMVGVFKLAFEVELNSSLGSTIVLAFRRLLFACALAWKQEIWPLSPIRYPFQPLVFNLIVYVFAHTHCWNLNNPLYQAPTRSRRHTLTGGLRRVEWKDYLQMFTWVGLRDGAGNPGEPSTLRPKGSRWRALLPKLTPSRCGRYFA